MADALMTNATSRFFAQFSLRELAGILYSQPPVHASRGFGGLGGGSGYNGPGARHSQKSESFALPISKPGDEIFNEPEFIRTLRKEVQSQITESGSFVTFEGEIAGEFNSSEFYLEYAEGKIQGRIIISGGTIGATYLLRATLEEKA